MWYRGVNSWNRRFESALLFLFSILKYIIDKELIKLMCLYKIHNNLIIYVNIYLFVDKN